MNVVHTVMSKLRVDVAKKMKLIPEFGHGDRWKLSWVVNPPLFEHDDETGRAFYLLTAGEPRTSERDDGRA